MKDYTKNELTGLQTLGMVLTIIGIISASLGMISSLVYLVYLWAQGMTFPLALWAGVKLWLWMVPGGVVTLFSGLFLMEDS